MTRWLTLQLAPLLRRMVAPETSLEQFQDELATGDRGDALLMASATWFLIMCLTGAAMLLATVLGSLVPAVDLLARTLLVSMFLALALVIAYTLAYGWEHLKERRRDRE
jgi:hypothetical protein